MYKKNYKMILMLITFTFILNEYILQGIVEGSASKPALIQYTNYMVEKTYHIAPYFGALGPI